jgi:hypothetical protein
MNAQMPSGGRGRKFESSHSDQYFLNLQLLVRSPPSQHWRTFLQNHSKDLISFDFLTVPTASFKVLYVLVILSNDRRRILNINVTHNPLGKSFQAFVLNEVQQLQ